MYATPSFSSLQVPGPARDRRTRHASLVAPNLGYVGRLLCALELRIDVELRPEGLEAELQTLHGRLHRPGDCLHGIDTNPTPYAGLVIREREADGEYYFYVEDTERRRLAGYTVFNRLVEVGRRADRYLRAPHSRYDAAYQRRGLASSIYRRYLAQGRCLISGARQSPGAHALWQALARDHQVGYVDLRGKVLSYLGAGVSVEVMGDLHTRMVLLGKGWTMEAFGSATGMR